MKTWKVVLIAAGCALISAVGVAVAQRTNYLGTVFIADTTTPTQQLKVNSDGSLNVDVQSGGGGSVTQGTIPWVVGGKDANGAAPTVNPIWFAGWDGTDQRAISTDSSGQLNVNVAGVAPVKSSVPIVNGGNFYEAVAASQTATVLQSSTGAAGDYLSHCVIYPASTSPGVVTVFDSTNTAANSAILFAGGSSSVSNLVPIPVPVGALSVNGAWKVTTGANVSVVCYGKFS